MKTAIAGDYLFTSCLLSMQEHTKSMCNALAHTLYIWQKSCPNECGKSKQVHWHDRR